MKRRPLLSDARAAASTSLPARCPGNTWPNKSRAEHYCTAALFSSRRDATSRLGYVLSVLASGLAVSFLFAVIHSQGWLGTPVLMALAFAFTLAREWRGTLLPSMLAHGINNLLATCLLLFLS